MIESSVHPLDDRRPGFYEFFAGGGMVRAGLGEGWRCLFANDIDAGKAQAYRANWGAGDFHPGDIGAVTAADLPGAAGLMWGSFPCQDLSLAGVGAGLGGRRSGTFHAFWDVARGLAAEGRAPAIVAVENVCGALTSRGGRDFEIVCQTYVDAGYRWGALVINADRFLPQSRPRLFVIGVRGDLPAPPGLIAPGPLEPFHPAALRRAVDRLPEALRARMVWWRLPEPGARPTALAALIEDNPADAPWSPPERTAGLLALMSPVNLAKVEQARRDGGRRVGALYRRTRQEADGRKVQRAEVRFDIAGCLRTPAGGSSRQTVLVVDRGVVRSRLISARETARLMGLADSYSLPASSSAAWRLTGDGVAVPVVRHLAEWLFEPILKAAAGARRAA
ncbi:DNA cytosine methyltransferase [Brevundimonas sp.]|uniref:DNA cytosine methyltransferase n=1 Tax=Brevundimonas sp. TaxID=1871086 RepID=UPI003567D587